MKILQLLPEASFLPKFIALTAKFGELKFND
jgi:hypothetical protein